MPPTSIRPRPPIEVWAFVVIVAAAALSMASGWDDVLTVDEVTHLGAGYSYLVRADMRMNPEHPPLVKLLAAAPLLALRLDHRAFASTRWEQGYWGQGEFARRLIYRTPGNDAVAITRSAHLGALPLLIVAALLLFSWANCLYGPRWALLAIVLFCFSPTVLAHGRLVTTDVGAALGVLLATGAFLADLRRSSRGSLVLAGVALGVAQLIKFSLLLLLPFFLGVGWLYVLIGPRGGSRWIGWARSTGRTVAIAILGFVLVVWPVYTFLTWGYPAKQQALDLQNHFKTSRLLHFASHGSAGRVLAVMSENAPFRGPAQYVLGALLVMDTVNRGHPVFWFGRVTARCGPGYFPLVYFLKEPSAWWGLVALGLLAAVGFAARALSRTRRDGSRATLAGWLTAHFTETVAMGWIALYWAMSLRSVLTIGVRHLLPVYPFTILLLVGLFQRLHRVLRDRSLAWARAAIGAILVLTVLYVLETVVAFPHFLSFFNALVGGSSAGHRFVADSNLDWGQDLARLCRFVETERIPKIELDYFGWADASTYCGEKAIVINPRPYYRDFEFLKRNQSSGWLAVSATHMHYHYIGADGPVGYQWLDRYPPVAAIGNSIFVYHITKLQPE